jgi:hypothetical protein
MTRPESSYEAASYDLTQFRERRLHDRRAVARGSVDRRMSKSEDAATDLPVADLLPPKAPESEAVARK